MELSMEHVWFAFFLAFLFFMPVEALHCTFLGVKSMPCLLAFSCGECQNYRCYSSYFLVITGQHQNVIRNTWITHRMDIENWHHITSTKVISYNLSLLKRSCLIIILNFRVTLTSLFKASFKWIIMPRERWTKETSTKPAGGARRKILARDVPFIMCKVRGCRSRPRGVSGNCSRRALPP